MNWRDSRLSKRLELPSKTLEELYQNISQIDAIKKAFELTTKISPIVLEKLTHSVIVTSAGSSNRIEGNQLTDKEVERLYRNLNIESFKTRDEQEVASYIKTLESIFEAFDDYKITEQFILQLNRDTLRDSTKDKGHRGKYKIGPNRVEARDTDGNIVKVIFDPTPPHLVEKEINELTNWYQWAIDNNFKHPLLLISNFIFEYLAIHPFQDGNGRTSRLITNLMLLKSGYSFAKIVSNEKLIEANKANYYIALNKTQQTWKTDNEDISPWLNFAIDTFYLQAQEAESLLQKDQFEYTLSEKQLAFWKWMSSIKEFSRKEAIEALELPPRTVESIIKKFFDENKIQRLGQGRATRYRVLEEK